MNCKPILFSTEMVQAIMEGRKSMTRRVIKPRYDKERERDARMGLFASIGLRNGMWHGLSPEGIPFVNDEIEQPRFQTGDILWVRETWCQGDVACGENEHGDAEAYVSQCIGENAIFLKEAMIREGVGIEGVFWKPSIFMPKAACRIFLRVTAVRAERLQEIREEDAIREGIMYTDFGMDTNRGSMSIDGGVTFHPLRPEHHPGFHAGDATRPSQCLFTARSAFGSLWDDINAKRAGGAYTWDKNPWVWVISFERADKPEGWPEVQHD